MLVDAVYLGIIATQILNLNNLNPEFHIDGCFLMEKNLYVFIVQKLLMIVCYIFCDKNYGKKASYLIPK